MKHKTGTICIRNVIFQKITKQTFGIMNISDLQFFIISRSGAIDTPGNMYFFTSTDAFFMHEPKDIYDFVAKFLPTKIPGPWRKINLHFCDDLFINPKIYDSFVHELCARNIRDFWLHTTIDIFRDKILKI